MIPNTPTLEISLQALTTNYEIIKSKLESTLCAAVVKANAYGLGMEGISKHLASIGCKQFFVATLAEAIDLRAVLPDATIYVFQGILPNEEKEFLHHRLIPVLNSMEQLECWEKVADEKNAVLHVDTGMTRLGLNETEALALVADNARIAKLGIRMVMSHLASANDGDAVKSNDQRMRFEKALRAFPQPMAASLANSAGVFLSKDYHYDIARVGCALYGITPITGKNPMQHVATLSAPILQIRTLDRDETVGYGATHAAKKGSRIAICALGYADGMMRSLSNRGFAYVADEKVPFVGRVSMDMIALDVSSIPEAKLADARAEFINARQDVNMLTALCDTIGYEMFTRMGNRVKRIYV
jgi:alanine racemase